MESPAGKSIGFSPLDVEDGSENIQRLLNRPRTPLSAFPPPRRCSLAVVGILAPPCCKLTDSKLNTTFVTWFIFKDREQRPEADRPLTAAGSCRRPVRRFRILPGEELEGDLPRRQGPRCH